MFKWEKKGKIWSPSLENIWMQEYGQNPNAIIMDQFIRIYFSSRKKNKSDGKYISYIFSVDVEKDNPAKIITINDTPILNSEGLGKPGHFDEFGTMPGSIVHQNDEIWLYYVGWQRSKTLPYMWANGLAVSKDKGVTFTKVGNGPIISSSYKYPFLQACPRAMQLENSKWIMWYAAGIEWFDYDNIKNPIYVLKRATSTNGVNWDLNNEQTIPSRCRKECQSSASVIEYNNTYHMFFSFREVDTQNPKEKQYRMGYASSTDLINWTRDDTQAGLMPSECDWDAHAVCYPHVVNVDNKIYMFYSGGKFGSAGFGYAEAKLDA